MKYVVRSLALTTLIASTAVVWTADSPSAAAEKPVAPAAPSTAEPGDDSSDSWWPWPWPSPSETPTESPTDTETPEPTPPSPQPTPPEDTDPPAPPPAPGDKKLPPVSEDGREVEPGPGRAWTLTSTKLKLSGSRYHGYVEQDVDGKKVKTLHFTVDKLEITDLVQRGKLHNGRNVKAAGAPGSVSTVTEGPIELYTQQLTGTLDVAGFPLIPMTLSPDTLLLPDLDLSFLKLPDLTFDDAVVHNVDLNGGNLHIPGSSITLE